ncbi:MAG: hypothetical protein IJR85_07850 [Synergistaceae bacterium]|nr:hypothetical protein [Synergistaceae bacterium]
MKIDAVILAKSTMWGKFCVAGIDIHSGMWVRFVGYEDGKPLDDSQMMFINAAGSCNPLDVARIRIARRIPRHNHVEDCMIHRDSWLKLGHMTIEEILQVHPEESYRYIFGNGMEYVTDEEMGKLRFRYSLILIRADNLTLAPERNRNDELRARAFFSHNNRNYAHIRVTDPEYEHLPETFTIGTAYLVMSMPVKPFNGRYYKLIAKIIPAENIGDDLF